jgi:hypothetical protein
VETQGLVSGGFDGFARAAQLAESERASHGGASRLFGAAVRNSRFEKRPNARHGRGRSVLPSELDAARSRFELQRF